MLALLYLLNIGGRIFTALFSNLPDPDV